MTDEERQALVGRRDEIRAKLKASTNRDGSIKPGAIERVQAIQTALDEIEARLAGAD